MKRWQANVLDYLKRPAHYVRSRRTDMDRVGTVCLALGPNRNLTTMTASLIALHPHCQVLNNAGKRHLPEASALLANPTDAELERFTLSAIYKSQGGKRGVYGGSITLAHSFDRSAMKGAFERRYGKSLIKKDIRCLYWKAAVRLTNYVRNEGIDLGKVVAGNDKLRFFMPIRNPLDCALSNWRTGHYRRLTPLKGSESPVPVVEFFVELIGWFMDYRKQYPDRFFSFHEHEYGEESLTALAGFLGVEADPRWIDDCMASRPKGGNYAYEPEFVAAYLGAIEKHLGDHPEARAALEPLATAAAV